jgi:hypothetical protein
MPVLQGIMSLGMSSSYPQYDWLCQMQRKYGPIDVSYDIRTEQFESPSGKDQNWFSASCVEPLTGEAFDSGVFTGRKGYSFYPPNALKIPLILEEINIRDVRVYYNNEEAAKHAAAGRALDCLHHRDEKVTSVFDSSNHPLNIQYCLEEP